MNRLEQLQSLVERYEAIIAGRREHVANANKMIASLRRDLATTQEIRTGALSDIASMEKSIATLRAQIAAGGGFAA